MGHAVAIDQFEGPLGLLLELVERNKMPVTDIAVGVITAQYLERIASLSGLTPDELSDFLQLGSRLIYIKSLALLPVAQPDEQADELSQLESELTEYRRYAAAAKFLADRTKSPSHTRGLRATLQPADLPMPDVSLASLAASFQDTLRRVQPVKPHQSLNVTELSQAEIMGGLKARLHGGSFALNDLLEGLRNRLEVVVTFSALLELIRSGDGRVTQDGQFGPIMVQAT